MEKTFKIGEYIYTCDDSKEPLPNVFLQQQDDIGETFIVRLLIPSVLHTYENMIEDFGKYGYYTYPHSSMHYWIPVVWTNNPYLGGMEVICQL